MGEFMIDKQKFLGASSLKVVVLIILLALAIASDWSVFAQSATDTKEKSEIGNKFKKQYERLQRLKDQEDLIYGIFSFYYSHSDVSLVIKDRLKVQAKITKKQLVALSEFSLDDLLSKPYGPTESGTTKKTRVLSSVPTSSVKLSKKALKEILQTTFPHGWVNNEVEAVQTLDNQNKTSSAETGAYQILADCNCPRNSERGIITFYQVVRLNNLSYVIRSLAHELSHANDWETDNEMSIEERNQLLLDVYERLSAPDRFQSPPVEQLRYIKNGKLDVAYTSWIKSQEYWAEICTQYFMDHTKLSLKDFALVDKCVKRGDPTFDVLQAQKKREEIITRLITKPIS